MTKDATTHSDTFQASVSIRSRMSVCLSVCLDGNVTVRLLCAHKDTRSTQLIFQYFSYLCSLCLSLFYGIFLQQLRRMSQKYIA